ncbi:hypothetical protein AD006_25555 [Pseudonocardia sp. EC080610-09]|nr:hypothetical protein AD006_25555 [Pseudonocardia sp. EC080610-09]ALL80748.1 hypothetical protein AD017_05145 [Pseudonocardia sp. EC080619-01]
MRSDRKVSEPSGCHCGSVTDSPGPPATTTSTPDARSRTVSSTSSHGIDGWSQDSQARVAPSGEIRGAATKSGPVTTTSGADGSRASSRTISLTTSVAGQPADGWCSRTATSQDPSGATSPSA